MPKFEYSVQLANGKTATRTSHRTYTHVIAVNGVRPEVSKKNRWDEVKFLEKQIEEYEQVAFGHKRGSEIFYKTCSEAQVREEYAEWLHDARKRLGDAKAAIIGGWTEPTDDTQAVLSWAGSLDLANKRARTESKTWAGVRVLPVTSVREIQPRKSRGIVAGTR